MKLLLSLVITLVSISQSYADATISKDNRVPNKSPGVCWWACADMIARELNITNLIGIRDKVLSSGIGRDSGATIKSIDHWIEKLELNPDKRFGPTKDISWLRNRLDKQMPIILSIRHWNGGESHAVILLRIGDEKENFKESKTGRIFTDYICKFIDPNEHKSTYTCTLGWLKQHWTGKAYAFRTRIHSTPIPPPPRDIIISSQQKSEQKFSKPQKPTFLLITPK